MERVSLLQNNHEGLIETLKKEILEAEENAIPMKWLEGGTVIDLPVKQRELALRASVHAENLTEFAIILELMGLTKEQIEDTLAHENAHANKAESIGAKFIAYSVVMLKDKKRKFFFPIKTTKHNAPFTYYSFPDEWDKETKERANIEILRAPEEYGHSLSKSDTHTLKNLNPRNQE